MARPLRIEFPGAFYHVMSRGNQRGAIVREHASRAVAVHLARRRFGHSAMTVAAALGYRDRGGVGRACRRIEQGTAKLRRTVERLEEDLLNPWYRPDPIRLYR